MYYPHQKRNEKILKKLWIILYCIYKSDHKRDLTFPYMHARAIL